MKLSLILFEHTHIFAELRRAHYSTHSLTQFTCSNISNISLPTVHRLNTDVRRVLLDNLSLSLFSHFHLIYHFCCCCSLFRAKSEPGLCFGVVLCCPTVSAFFLPFPLCRRALKQQQPRQQHTLWHCVVHSLWTHWPIGRQWMWECDAHTRWWSLLRRSKAVIRREWEKEEKADDAAADDEDSGGKPSFLYLVCWHHHHYHYHLYHLFTDYFCSTLIISNQNRIYPFTSTQLDTLLLLSSRQQCLQLSALPALLFFAKTLKLCHCRPTAAGVSCGGKEHKPKLNHLNNHVCALWSLLIVKLCLIAIKALPKQGFYCW